MKNFHYPKNVFSEPWKKVIDSSIHVETRDKVTRSVKRWCSLDERGDASSKEKERLEVEAWSRVRIWTSNSVIGKLSFAWTVIITFISAIEERCLHRIVASQRYGINTFPSPSRALLDAVCTIPRGFAQRSRNACRAFRKMRRGQGQGQVHSRIITLSISSCDS